MRVIFAGTPVFSLSSLEALVTHPAAAVVAVYTQPDRPAGRGKKLTPSPVKARALELDIEVYQPESFKVPGATETLESLQPDLMIVTAYGLILPQKVLDIPRLGCINVHASLLPRWRGAAPIQRAIEAGDETTGVTLIQMEAGLDTGPMLAQVEVAIDAEDTGGSLHDKLSVAGGRLLSDALDDISRGGLQPIRQNDDDACYAEKFSKPEARIDWRQPASVIAKKVRAFNPWPVANTLYDSAQLRILAAVPVAGDSPIAQPGTITDLSQDGIQVATGEGLLLITRLQKAGSKPMAVRDFLNGVTLEPGDQFGQA